MKTTRKKQSRRSVSCSLSGKPLEIRVIGAEEHKRLGSLLGAYHDLGENRPVGDAMRMVAEIDGEGVGLLMWGSACYRQKPRNTFIGGIATQRARRQKRIVQNRRFLLLAERGAFPNPASRIPGAVVRVCLRVFPTLNI